MTLAIIFLCVAIGLLAYKLNKLEKQRLEDLERIYDLQQQLAKTNDLIAQLAKRTADSIRSVYEFIKDLDKINKL